MNAEVLDLREDLKKGCAPFGKIMAAAAKIDAGASLVLITPFEPVPLYAVLQQQGFSHSSSALPGGEWEVRFTRDSGGVLTSSGQMPPVPPCAVAAKANVVEIDTRGNEPPQPLVLILEALASLPADAELHARTDRRPMHLYPQLEARGFSGATEEQSDGSFITIIRRV